MKLAGENRSTQGKNLFTINHTRTEPGSNPGLRGDRPASNCLSHGTALLVVPYDSMLTVVYSYNNGMSRLKISVFLSVVYSMTSHAGGRPEYFLLGGRGGG
jgi:hypothetical protein